jgi:hypothetical protein
MNYKNKIYTHVNKVEVRAIDRMSKSCKESSQKAKNKYNSFVDRVNLINVITGEFRKLQDYDNKRQHRSYYVSDQFNVFHDVQIKKGLVPVFVTLTKSSKNLIGIDDKWISEIKELDKKNNSSESIDEHIDRVIDSNFSRNIEVNNKYLESAHRDIYNNFRPNGNRHFRVWYISVTEPHKSFFPHQHNIYYIPAEYVDKFISHVNRVEDNYSINTHKEEKRIKVLDSSKFSIIYLLKYVNKSIKSDSLLCDDIDGWYKKHKIRQYRTSRGEIRFNLKLYSLYIQLINFKYDNIITGIKKIKVKKIDNENLIDKNSKTIYILKKDKLQKRIHIDDIPNNKKIKLLKDGLMGESDIYYYPIKVVNSFICPFLPPAEYKIS